MPINCQVSIGLLTNRNTNRPG